MPPHYVTIELPRPVARRFVRRAAASLAEYDAWRQPTIAQTELRETCRYLVHRFDIALASDPASPVSITFEYSRAHFEADRLRETLERLDPVGQTAAKQLTDGWLVYQAFRAALDSTDAHQ